MQWTETPTGTKNEERTYTIHTNSPGGYFQVIINGKITSRVRANKTGDLILSTHTTGKAAQHIQVKKV